MVFRAVFPNQCSPKNHGKKYIKILKYREKFWMFLEVSWIFFMLGSLQYWSNPRALRTDPVWFPFSYVGAPRDVKNSFAVFRIRNFWQTMVLGVKSP